MQSLQGINKKDFDEIFRCHYKRIFHFINRIVRNNDVSEDIVQDIFFTLWEKREIIRKETVLFFLIEISKNKAMDFFRNEEKSREFEKLLVSELKLYDENPTSEEDFLELESKADEILSQMPESTREIFVLSRRSGLKYKDIANNLGISIKTVEKNISKALIIIKENFSKEK